MEFRQLRYFLMLADEQHFKKAAERLFIVQPALSKQIRQLEVELGIELFERNKRNVQLTEAGKFFKEQVSNLLQNFERIKNETAMVAGGEKGELRIGYVGSCIHTFLPGLLSRLHSGFPHVQTYLSEMTSALQLEALQKGTLDIAFLRNPGKSKCFGQKLVFRESFSLVLPASHRLTPRNFKSMMDVQEEWFILPTKGDGELYHQLQWSICEDAGFTPMIAHETVHGYTTLKLVESGLGVSLLPTSFKKVSNAEIKFIELRKIPQMAEITAVWDKENPNPSLRNFLKMLEETP